MTSRTAERDRAIQHLNPNSFSGAFRSRLKLKRLLRRPAEVVARNYFAIRQTQFSYSSSKAHPPPVRQSCENGPLFILRLFLLRSPAHVAGAVITVIVYAMDRMLGRWTAANIE
jgi:hypothetical protein